MWRTAAAHSSGSPAAIRHSADLPPVRHRGLACGPSCGVPGGETPVAGDNPGDPVLGRVWGLWSRGKPGASRREGNPQGGTLSQRRRENFKVWAEGETLKSVRRRKLWVVGEGKTSSCAAEGKPRVA